MSTHFVSAHDWADKCEDLSERRQIFQDRKAIAFATKLTLTTKRLRQADNLFVELEVGGRRLGEKQKVFRLLYQTLLRAHLQGATIMIPRHKTQPNYDVRMQTIDAAVKYGLAREVRSCPGKKASGRKRHVSRLLPTQKLVGNEKIDPWSIEPNTMSRFVYIYERRRGEEKGPEIPFKLNHPIAKKWQAKLERINAINSSHEITYRPYLSWSNSFAPRYEMLRPIHYASFTDSFEFHGRIYTDVDGHQGLLRIERETILFDERPTIELDYSGLHTRLLYHLEGIDYRDDPYALWGRETTEPQRLLVKTYINTLINAGSSQIARDACNWKMRRYTDKTDQYGKRRLKTGKAYLAAIALYDATRKTGLRFGDLFPLVMQKHARISHRLENPDTGLRLMRIDSEIALNVMYYFAKRHIPILGCHDSFRVPFSCRVKLLQVMQREYENKVGFLPIVK